MEQNRISADALQNELTLLFAHSHSTSSSMQTINPFLHSPWEDWEPVPSDIETSE